MPLHRGSFDVIKNIFVSRLAGTAEAKAAFAALAPKAQVEAVIAALDTDETCIADGISDQEAAAFVAVFLTQTGQVKDADLPALRDTLGIPAPSGWKKELPYVNVLALQTMWPEEWALVPDMAATLSHAAISGDVSVVDTMIAASVRAILGIGGLEDAADPRAIGVADPIMKLFIDAVKFQLMAITQPAWFKNGKIAPLAAGVDGRSAYEVKKAIEAEKLKVRAEARRVANAKRRQELLAIYATKRNAVIARMRDAKEADAVVKAMLAVDFASLKELTKEEVWLPAELHTAAKKYAVTTPPEAEVTEAQAINFMQQYLLTAVAAAHPDWFLELASGDIGLRRGIGKISNGFDRAARSVRRQVSKLIHRYGPEKVLEQLKLFVADYKAVLVAADEPEEADEVPKA